MAGGRERGFEEFTGNRRESAPGKDMRLVRGGSRRQRLLYVT
jgi:hypothetical protein